MRWSGAHVALLAGLVSAGVACVARSPYTCLLGEECVEDGRQGQCEPTGFCAFPDDTCGSGFRYGALAGDDLANACSDARRVDDGAPDPADALYDARTFIDATLPIDAPPPPPDSPPPPPCSGVTLLGMPCDGPDTDLCADGVWICNPDNVSISCGDTSGPNPELCNNVDDDCNGAIDDGAAGASCLPVGDTCRAGQCYCGDRPGCFIGICYPGSKCGP